MFNMRYAGLWCHSMQSSNVGRPCSQVPAMVWIQPHTVPRPRWVGQAGPARAPRRIGEEHQQGEAKEFPVLQVQGEQGPDSGSRRPDCEQDHGPVWVLHGCGVMRIHGEAPVPFPKQGIHREMCSYFRPHCSTHSGPYSSPHQFAYSSPYYCPHHFTYSSSYCCSQLQLGSQLGAQLVS